MPALKRRIKIELFSATLKRCFPLQSRGLPPSLIVGGAAGAYLLPDRGHTGSVEYRIDHGVTAHA
jgi:hypothetical protein